MRNRRSLIWTGISLIIAFVIFVGAEFVHFSFFMPDFQSEHNGTIVYGKVVLVPLKKNEIRPPNNLWFWDTIGYLKGQGTLYKFSQNGKMYALYIDNTEMPLPLVYSYKSK